MQKLLYIALMLSLIGLASSCGEDSFTQVVEVDLPDHESAIAINALFSDLDTSLQMLVSNSLGILDTATHASMKDASVNLYKDDAMWQSFQFNPTNYRFETSLMQPLEKGIYRLEVEAEGYKAVMAEQEMPTAVPLVKVEINEDGAISGEGERVDELIVKIDDPGGEENYYALQGYVEQHYYDQQANDTLYFRNKFYMESLDQVIQFGDRYDILLTDGAFDGRSYTLRLFTFSDLPFGQENTRVVMQLVSLTRDAYLYDRSLNQYYNSIDNPFAEPVVVHNNVDEGYGIFGLSAIEEYIVEIE